MKILLLIGLTISMFGVMLIYDARLLTKKLFGFGDQNEATKGMKMLGYIISIIGGLIVFFNV